MFDGIMQSGNLAEGAMQSILRELEPERRVYRSMAFNLKGPGTYVRTDDAAYVVGNRPGAFHYLMVGVCWAVGIPVAWLFGTEVPWLGGIIALLFVALPALILFNRQRTEVRRGVVQARGSALGRRIERDWPLPSDSSVRLEASTDYNGSPGHWTRWQVQIRIDDGWLGLLELMHDPTPLEPHAAAIARAAGVPLAPAATQGEPIDERDAARASPSETP